MKNDKVPCASARGGTAERRWAILQEVQRNYHVSVAKLSQHFSVSRATIRRDLTHLEKMGLLQRVHGGAQALSLAEQNLLFDARLLQRTAVKCSIGQTAAALIRPGDIILLDSGTTVLEIARRIPPALLEEGGLTVITRSLVIASELRSRRHIRLILLGGVYVHSFDTIVGSQVENALQGMHVDVLFIGTDGVTADFGLTTDNLMEAGLYPIMASRADRVVVVTDSSKIGVRQLQAILSLNEIHTFVTDSDAPDDFVNMLEEKGIEVLLAPKP
ncbi:MAG: DeoR family transcriptional regulator [Anaerolineae bacterium]|nr:DeoR family transcriptional regulator [Anaerolineae bacterium]